MAVYDTKGRPVIVDIETAYSTVYSAGIQAAGVSTFGNTAGNTGTSTGTLVLAGSNSISLSQVTDANGATVWIQLTGGGAADGVNIISLSGNTSGTLTTQSTGTVVLAGGANITLSQSSNSITISGGAGGGGVALSAGTQIATSGSVVFSNANNLTFGMSNSSVVTGSASFSQTAQTVGLYASSNTTGQSSSSTYDARTISLRGAGIISVGNSGGEFIISASAAGAADGYNIVSASGNTSGTLTSYTTGTIVLAGGNNITLSQSSNSITISGANVGGAQTGISGIGASDTTYSSGTVIFSGQNNVTIGSSTNGASQYVRLSVGNYITTGMASDEPHLRAIVYSNATQTSGTLYLSGSNGITISSGANSAIIAFDGHHLDALLPSGNGYGTGFSSMTSGTVGIHATGALSMSQNGNALSLSVPAQTTQPVAASGSNGSFAFSTLSFGISNGVTFYTTNNSIVASHNALTTAAQSNQVVNSLNGSTGAISLATGSSLSSSQNGSTITFGLASNITTALQSAGAYLTTAANSTHSHGNISLALTNLTGTTASASSGMTLSLSAAAPGGGGIAAAAGTQTATSGTVVWSDSNNVSFGMTNSSVITASATFAQTNQQGSIYASSNTFGTSSGTYDARTLSIAGSGAVSVAASNSGWVVSAPVQTAESQSIGMSTQTAGGGTGGTTGYASGAQVRYHLVPGSNVTMSQSLNGASGTLSIYAAAGGGGAYGFGVSNTGHTAGNTGTYSSATFVLAGSSSLTLSQSTGAASVHTIWLQPAMSQLTAGSGMSLSSGGSTVTINMTAQQSIGMSTQTAGGGTGGTTGYASGTGIRYHLVPGSNITMSQSLNGASGTLSIYAPAAGAAAITQSVGISNVTAGGSTGGTSGMVTGDDIQYLFVPGSNITMSQSINGSSGTITIYGTSGGGGAGPTLYFYDHIRPIVGTTTMSVMGSTSHIQPIHLHNDYSFQWLRFPMSVSGISTTFSVSGGAATFTASNVSTCYVVIYKLGDGASSESLQYVTSGSGAFTHLKSMAYQTSSTNTSRTFTVSHYWTYPFETGTSSTSRSTTYGGVSFNLVSTPMTVFGTGLRMVDLIPLATTISARAYWMAVGWSSGTGSQSFSAATGARVNVSHVAVTQINSSLGFLGQGYDASVQWQKGIGSMTTNAIGTTASYPLSRISSSASYPIMPFQGIAIA